MIEEVESSFRGSLSVLWASFGTSVLLAVLFLAVLALLDAQDRAPQLAVLHALGWRRRAVAALVGTEVAARGVPAVLLAAALGPLLASWLASRIAEVSGYRLSPSAPASLHLLALGCALLAVPLGAWPAVRAARRATRPGSSASSPASELP